MFYISKLLKDADKEDKPKKTVNENKKTQKLTLKKTTLTKYLKGWACVHSKV